MEITPPLLSELSLSHFENLVKGKGGGVIPRSRSRNRQRNLVRLGGKLKKTKKYLADLEPEILLSIKKNKKYEIGFRRKHKWNKGFLELAIPRAPRAKSTIERNGFDIKICGFCSCAQKAPKYSDPNGFLLILLFRGIPIPPQNQKSAIILTVSHRFCDFSILQFIPESQKVLNS